jgi:hypothetical protein
MIAERIGCPLIKEVDDAFGSQASCIMILATSTWSRNPATLDNPFGTRLSPMS